MASTHAELAARLLRDAAAFFDTIGAQNPPLTGQMRENALVFRRVADLVEADPTGALPDGPGDSHDDRGIAGHFP